MIRDLSKRYGSKQALWAVKLTLTGGVVALLGPNGSGKSTLLRILATLCTPDEGVVSFGNWIYPQHTRRLRPHIGYLPQDFDMPDTLTPRKLLAYLAQLRGGDVQQAVKQLRLEALLDHPFHALSSGQRRRVGIAQALLGQPRLLLLDELSRGLDILERENVYRLLGDPADLTIFSTHIPEEAERIAQTVIVLAAGHVRFCGTVDALREQAVGQVYEVNIAADRLPHLMKTHVISRMSAHGSETRVRVVGSSPSRDAALVAPSLEDAYLLLRHSSLKGDRYSSQGNN
jgi:ABC-2 type transport system ATP-binding protein